MAPVKYARGSARLPDIIARQARRGRIAGFLLDGDDAKSQGIESVTYLVPNAVALDSGGSAMVPVSLPRVRFLESRISVPAERLPADRKGTPPHSEPDLSAGPNAEGRR